VACALPIIQAAEREGKKPMRMLAKARRWWFVAAAAAAVALPLAALNGPAAQALSIEAQSTGGLVISGTATPGGTLSISATGFTTGETVNCTITGSAATGGTITPVVSSFTAGAGGALSGSITVPAGAAVGSTLSISCRGATSGFTAVGAVAVVAAPPAVPEADVLVLFGTGLAGLGGYAAVRARSLRRKLPF